MLKVYKHRQIPSDDKSSYDPFVYNQCITNFGSIVNDAFRYNVYTCTCTCMY
jgi:hypothetical protein